MQKINKKIASLKNKNKTIMLLNKYGVINCSICIYPDKNKNKGLSDDETGNILSFLDLTTQLKLTTLHSQFNRVTRLQNHDTRLKILKKEYPNLPLEEIKSLKQLNISSFSS